MNKCVFDPICRDEARKIRVGLNDWYTLGNEVYSKASRATEEKPLSTDVDSSAVEAEHGRLRQVRCDLAHGQPPK